MNKETIVSATIVLFKEEISTLKETVACFLKTSIEKKLFLIDNNPTNRLEKEFNHSDLEYIFTGKNIGFGAAHNIVLNKINSQFHLILNPDVEFNATVIPLLIDELGKQNSVSFITPKIIYPNYQMQYVCRKHPTIFDLINRKIKISKNQNIKNQYKNLDLEKTFYPEFIHGCFMLFKTEEFKNLNGFDERYFLYMEDADICRRIEKNNKKIQYYPKVKVIHQHQQGSSKNIKLFFRHISSAIKYFLKWGF
ncbi:glycosyltransferase [Polaribacter batillariae]|uniref:Glycosyltransferase n=1 Tax=Polaribacter batillariae TaxID=2808900 RepID=A0ABX7SS26_9FLAO|nr:glycosyltransferase [Polaribacter batillariae]QTD36218.1 glycosyltransferase [Polaribacter batillariae]